MNFDYFKEFDSAVTICDKNAIIVYMNEKSKTTFPNTKTGEHLFKCHSEKSIDKINFILSGKTANTYSIEKNGIKKLIHQAPWFENGEIAGLIEISILLPQDLTHHNRD